MSGVANVEGLYTMTSTASSQTGGGTGWTLLPSSRDFAFAL
jgi:hypothetical protein